MVMSTGILVKDAMVSKVATIMPSQTAVEAAKKMKIVDVGLLVVVEDSKPIGVVTREDIVNKVVSENQDPNTTEVRKIMNMPVVSVSIDTDLSAAARIMVEHGFQRLPVISSGKLVGLISDREVLKVAPAAIEILRERLFMKDDVSGLEKSSEPETQEGECEICGNYDDSLENINDKWVCSSCKDEDS